MRRVITTRRTTVFHSIKISGLSVEATIRWLRNVPPLARFRAHGGSLSLSAGSGGHGVTTLPTWRPWRISCKSHPPK